MREREGERERERANESRFIQKKKTGNHEEGKSYRIDFLGQVVIECTVNNKAFSFVPRIYSLFISFIESIFHRP